MQLCKFLDYFLTIRAGKFLKEALLTNPSSDMDGSSEMTFKVTARPLTLVWLSLHNWKSHRFGTYMVAIYIGAGLGAAAILRRVGGMSQESGRRRSLQTKNLLLPPLLCSSPWVDQLPLFLCWALQRFWCFHPYWWEAELPMDIVPHFQWAGWKMDLNIC